MCTYMRDSNFKVGIQDSLFIKGEIQDSNLNLRKMAGIQHSNLVFKGPNTCTFSIGCNCKMCFKQCTFCHVLIMVVLLTQFG